MNRMLKYDGFRLKKSKYWLICLGINLLFMLMSIFIFNSINNLAQIQVIDTSTIVKTIISSDSGLLFVIVVCIFIGNDFKTGFIKNIASKGIKRTDMILSKLVWIVILAVVFILLQVVVGFATLIITTEFTISSIDFGELSKSVAIIILQQLAFSSICVFISYLLKSSGSSIASSIGVSIALPLIAQLLDNLVLKLDNFKIYDIIPEKGTLIIQSGDFMSSEAMTYIIAMLCYILVFISLSLFVFNKNDIK